ncbi:Hypothetical protein FKW44_004946 [Caligus rogercresseyi]|uniref:CCHC-type domain-containing protein n=1 Tax=Caligus rogercresseyi TaxID=217165 RepID=A0A7T8HMH6_CALRO|nr:Hypothetical protein FKW44_004946 [Caligus rogercresseyi]
MGRKVELISSMQEIQCFKCMKFGHIKTKCTRNRQTKYAEFKNYFRKQIGLPTRIQGSIERNIVEEAVREEELEEEEEDECSHSLSSEVILEENKGLRAEENKEGAGEDSKEEAEDSNITQEPKLRADWKLVLQKTKTS